jgi:thiamine-phosphate pyrophosphorylase
MMTNQPPWPREWLMTDERMGDRLWAAMDRVPPGGGIVVRHHSMPEEERAELAGRVADMCRKRGLVLAIARHVALAEELDAALVHNPAGASRLPLSLSVHDEAEAVAAREARAALVFVSPVYSTRSHPGAPSLGPEEAARLAEIAGSPAIALGGMSRERSARLGEPFYGWAGIDCWLT